MTVSPFIAHREDRALRRVRWLIWFLVALNVGQAVLITVLVLT